MLGVPGSVEERFGGEIARGLSLKPSEYWARQCYLGASFMGPHDCAVREATGVGHDHVGERLPAQRRHAPLHEEALRYTFAGVDPDEVRLMLGTNAARAYGFDLDALSALADRSGRWSPTSRNRSAPTSSRPTRSRPRSIGCGSRSATSRRDDRRPSRHRVGRHAHRPAARRGSPRVLPGAAPRGVRPVRGGTCRAAGRPDVPGPSQLPHRWPPRRRHARLADLDRDGVAAG